MSLPSVYIHKPTKAIVKRGLYPRHDLGEIIGQDPDYVWLLEYTPFPAPDYDPRYFKLVTEVPDLALYNFDLEHPDYPHTTHPHLSVYKTTYSLVKRPTEEIEVHVKNAQRLADESIFRSQEQMTSSVKTMAILRRAQQGLTLTLEEEALLSSLDAMNVNVAKNLDNYNLLMGLITAGAEPDIDAGWEKGI